VPRYEEVNPALFTIVTFPYLFGVMFGDIGHGGVLFAIGILLVMKDKQLKNTPIGIISPARYLFFLMGMFSFFNGIIYNDFFGITMKLFSTCYGDKLVKDERDCVYFMGIDPAWYQSVNEVTFLNSFKMKLSIIIGVIHMSFGICIRAVNAVFWKNWVDLVFEFIPQIIFMMVTFGYMCVAIIIKWTTNWDDSPYPPPSILNIYTGAGVTVIFFTNL
jgi:V-type H+-transporting ATPase subunit a